MGLDEILQSQLTQGKFDEAIRQITEIGLKKDISSVPILIKYLDSTEDSGLRNAIAVALSDIGCEEAIEHILVLLKDPKTHGNRGTLLYALQEFDLSGHLSNIAEFLFDDGFEVSRQALSLIQSNRGKLSAETVHKITERVESEVEKLEEKLDFLEEALVILEQK